MAKPRNKPIGTCPCDTLGCSSTAQVMRMKGTPRGSAGPLYLACPSCGQVRKTSAAFQDYILENAEITGAMTPEPPQERKPEPAPETPEPGEEPKPAKVPEKPAPAPERIPEPKPQTIDQELNDWMT